MRRIGWIVGTVCFFIVITLFSTIFLRSGANSVTFAQTEPTAQPFIQDDFTVLTGDVQRPNGIFWHDGFLYTACAGDWTLYRIDALTGDTLTYIPAVKNTHMLYVEDGPVVWVADFESSRVARISRDTGLVPVKEGLSQPWGIVPSLTDDTFYLTQWGTDDLIKMTREGNVTVVAGGFEDPSGLVATEDSIYIANNGSARRAIEWLDISNPNTQPTLQPLVSGLQKVTNLVMGQDGKLYIAYALGRRGAIGRIDPEICKAAGGCTNTQIELVVWTELAAPLAGLAISPDNRLYVHTMFGSEIYWLDLPAIEEAAAE